ncbi:MAG TPA: carbon-nitrogen hydrolase family protein [Fimbriimonadaceae bacterium]|nr:carbon-nitrogen hydrolase family protein [Fimbriimonadaceae bacterium]
MRVACVQSDVVFNDPGANAANAVQAIERLADQGVQVAVFPEAFLTGYCVSTLEDARRIAIPADHESLDRLAVACERLGMILVVGFAESTSGALYNSAAIFYDGKRGLYRKAHLPWLGLDRFVAGGDAFTVFDTSVGRIGVLICFDLRQPEPSRILALDGADLIALPTNWPRKASIAPSLVAPVRAAENRVFLAACNRIGEENGFGFIGSSGIFAPSGEALFRAGDAEEVLVADLDLAEARFKRTVVIPGQYEMATFDSRRPELYGRLTEPKR